MFTILKKELKMHFTSFFAYFYYAFFFLTLGILFSYTCLKTYTTQFGYFVLSRAVLVVLAVIPLCTMHVFANERRNKTDQLLFTAPISTLSILLGKYLATIIFVLLPILLSSVYPLCIQFYGYMNIKFLLATYLAVILITILATSVGLFVSALSSNSVIAAIVTYIIFAITYLSGMLEKIISGEMLYQFIHEISIYNKFNNMISGIIKTGDIFYILILITTSFLLTWLILLARRQDLRAILMQTVIIVLLSIGGSVIVFNNVKVYDFTSEQILTLSEKTKKVVKEIDQITDIYYFGDRYRMNVTYEELLNEYKKLNNNIKVHYKDVSIDSKFRDQYLKDIRSINEASMLVVSGDKYIFLDSKDYVNTVIESKYSVKTMLQIENEITSAIYYTNSEALYQINLLSGHGELPLPHTFKNLLLINDYKFKTLDLQDSVTSLRSEYANANNILFILAPQSDYNEDEINILKRYLDAGGKMIVALDPLNENLKNLYAFLEEYGLKVESGILVEENKEKIAFETLHYMIPDIKYTPITSSLLDDSLSVVTMTSKGITVTESKYDYKVTELLTTSSTSYSKVEGFDRVQLKTDRDISGPFSISAISENENDSRLCLLTSYMFFDEEVDRSTQNANRKFLLEIANHMIGSEQVLMIDGKDIGNQVALYPNNKLNMLKIITIVLVPFLILGIGLFVLFKRNYGFSLFSKGNIERMKKLTKKENEGNRD